MSKWLKVALASVVGGTAAAIAASAAVYHAATHVSNQEKEEGHQRAVAENTATDNVWYLKQPIQEWRITSYDGLTLRASFIPAPHASKRVAILAHGINHAREQMIPYAKLFHDWDYQVLMPDARAQGESEGHRIGLGWPDRLDYVDWVTEVIDELGDDVEIVLMGISMGAATVLATAGEALPPNVKAVVADSGFASVYDISKTILKEQYHLPAFPMMSIADWLAKWLTGSRMSQERIIDQVKQASVPILLIHGESDEVVPFENADALYRAIAHNKERYYVPGAKHIESYATNPARYREVVKEFLADN